MTLTTSLALFLSAVTLNNNTTLASTASQAPIVESQITIMAATPIGEPSEEIAEPIVSVEQYVKTYFAKSPILAKVAKCESHYRQFASDGNVLRGMAVPADVGVMQINETYHKATAERLGYNIYTLDGNLSYAQYLYDKEGVQPWSASRACWSK